MTSFLGSMEYLGKALRPKKPRKQRMARKATAACPPGYSLLTCCPSICMIDTISAGQSALDCATGYVQQFDTSSSSVIKCVPSDTGGSTTAGGCVWKTKYYGACPADKPHCHMEQLSSTGQYKPQCCAEDTGGEPCPPPPPKPERPKKQPYVDGDYLKRYNAEAIKKMVEDAVAKGRAALASGDKQRMKAAYYGVVKKASSELSAELIDLIGLTDKTKGIGHGKPEKPFNLTVTADTGSSDFYPDESHGNKALIDEYNYARQWGNTAWDALLNTRQVKGVERSLVDAIWPDASDSSRPDGPDVSSDDVADLKQAMTIVAQSAGGMIKLPYTLPASLTGHVRRGRYYQQIVDMRDKMNTLFKNTIASGEAKVEAYKANVAQKAQALIDHFGWNASVAVPEPPAAASRALRGLGALDSNTRNLLLGAAVIGGLWWLFGKKH